MSVMRALYSVFFSLALFVFSSVQAAEIGSWAIKKWTISAYTDDKTGSFSHCAMIGRYESGVSVVFGVGRSYTWDMALYNPKWRILQGQTYEVQIIIDGVSLSLSNGVAVQGDIIGITLPDSTYLFSKMRAGRALTLRIGSAQFQFSLEGTADALAATLACVSRYREASPQTGPAPQQPAPPPSYTPPTEAVLAQATVALANALSGIGVQNYKILSSEEKRSQFPWKDIVWVSPTVAGWLDIMLVNRNSTMEEVIGTAIGLASADCKGKFSSTRLETTKDYARLSTECTQNNATVESYLVLTARDNVSYYEFSFVSLGASGDAKGRGDSSLERLTARLVENMKNNR